MNTADESFISTRGGLWKIGASIPSVTLALGLGLRGATTSSVFILLRTDGPAASLSEGAVGEDVSPHFFFFFWITRLSFTDAHYHSSI